MTRVTDVMMGIVAGAWFVGYYEPSTFVKCVIGFIVVAECLVSIIRIRED